MTEFDVKAESLLSYVLKRDDKYLGNGDRLTYSLTDGKIFTKLSEAKEVAKDEYEIRKVKILDLGEV